MVVQPDFREISSNQSMLTSKITTSEDIIERINIAYTVALEKLIKYNGTLEIIVQTGEAFGRGIFYEFLQRESEDWTMKKWLETTIKNIFNPIGASLNIAELTEDQARSLITQFSFNKNDNESNIASFFTYGFIRGLLLSAFPKGEIIMGDTIMLDVPLTEFIFKTNATTLDKSLRNNIKNLYTVKKN